MEIDMYYAQFAGRPRALAFPAPSDRDDYVNRHAAARRKIKSITACEAFRMTPPADDGSRIFYAPQLGLAVREP